MEWNYTPHRPPLNLRIHFRIFFFFFEKINWNFNWSLQLVKFAIRPKLTHLFHNKQTRWTNTTPKAPAGCRWCSGSCIDFNFKFNFHWICRLNFNPFDGSNSTGCTGGVQFFHSVFCIDFDVLANGRIIISYNFECIVFAMKRSANLFTNLSVRAALEEGKTYTDSESWQLQYRLPCAQRHFITVTYSYRTKNDWHKMVVVLLREPIDLEFLMHKEKNKS